MFKDPRAQIIRKESWNNYHLLALKSPLVARQSQPGQFLMVRVSGQPYPLLRRPFSIHGREKDVLEIFFAEAGIGTMILADKKTGETLDILGPLGNGFRIRKRLGRRLVVDPQLKGKTVFLVGGGRGIAPLFFLAQELRTRGIRPRIFYGGKTEADIPLLDKFAAQKHEIFISTDDGSFGYHGFVSALLEKELARMLRTGARSLLSRPSPAPLLSRPRGHLPPALPACIFACGPDAMMRKIAEIAVAARIPAQFSLESVMGCGIGACWGCVKKIKRGDTAEWVKICEEGPVFEGAEIVWEEQDEPE